MNFKLDFKLAKAEWRIEPSTKLFFAGSCFAENIFEIFESYKFDVCCNTHGILFNPISIANSLKDCVTGRTYVASDLIKSEDLYCSLSHHGRFSNMSEDVCLKEINKEIHAGANALQHADLLLITFGSAYVYKHKETSRIVANCHKIPQNNFDKILLTEDEIINAYKQPVVELKKFNPKIKIVFTVSPVRYIRDGIVENNLSKSVLIKSVHEIIKQTGNCFYFPAYEIVMDELRDYRFFEEDLVHPNKLAIKYVWEKFAEHAFSDETKNYISELQQLITAAIHRPLNPETPAHKKFKEEFKLKLQDFIKRYPSKQLEDLSKSFN